LEQVYKVKNVFAWYEYIDEKKCKVGELENSKEKGW
jgi:hypothetical protein